MVLFYNVISVYNSISVFHNLWNLGLETAMDPQYYIMSLASPILFTICSLPDFICLLDEHP